jgi:hypothetical protein
MKPETLANRLDQTIKAATDNLEGVITRTQTKILGEMVAILKNLETDSEGYIKQSVANRKILQEASDAFDSAFRDSTYKQGLEKFIGVIPKVDSLNSEYFSTLSSGFKPNAQYVSNLRSQTVKDLETYLLNDGIESQIKTPLLEILNQNVNSSARFTDMLKQVEEAIIGSKELDGRLLSYSKQITTDSVFNYSRSYQQAITSDLGLDTYLYAGGIIAEGKYSGGTRDFCIARVGKKFKHKEVESWASLSWQGRRRGTTASTIFIFCGGYNCRHQLIPVND